MLYFFDALSRLANSVEPELESTQRQRIETRRHPLSRFHKNSWLPLIIVCLLVFLISSDSVLANAQPSAKPRSYVVRTKNTHLHVRRCKVFSNPPMHILMDRVCLFCHNSFSHTNPNLHSECRSNCFDNDQFRKCLKIFSRPGISSNLPEPNNDMNNLD